MRDDERRQLLVHALRSPRGRYRAERAAHLSGVPKSTVYEWQRHGVLVPDYPSASPLMWSYRDLVFLRILARMRQDGIDRPTASDGVRQLRERLSQPGSDITTVRIGGGLYVGDETQDIVTGQYAFAHVLQLTERFDLLEPIEGVNDKPTWGPDLVEPSEHTYISPNVMGGEPCVDSSRVPSATVLALTDQRGLSPTKIVRLYPQLSEEGVEDAVDLERRMRRDAA